MGEIATVYDLVWEKIDKYKNNAAVIFDDGQLITTLTYQQMHSAAEKVNLPDL